MQKDCKLQVVKTNNGKSSWNAAFQKNSPWNKIISRKILEYKEKGFFDDVTKRWIHSSCTSQSTVTLTNHKFKIKDFSGLILVFIVVLIVSIIILLVERLIFKWKTKTSKYSFRHN